MSVTGTRLAKFAVLRVQLPGQDPVNVGVLLQDPATDRLHLRLRRDWQKLGAGDVEMLEALEDQLVAEASAAGAESVMARLLDVASNVIQISARSQILVQEFGRTLDRLYREQVQATVQPFVTHLPRYSLAVAAGPFLENREVEAEGWEELPPQVRLTPAMFVARIAGRSMEPLIPDGALCVFRRGVAGSRQGRLVLVEALGRGANDRYTVKRYRSEKVLDADGAWRQGRIRLEPLNPEFEAWELEPEEDQYRVLAEFVCVLD